MFSSATKKWLRSQYRIEFFKIFFSWLQYTVTLVAVENLISF